MKYKERKRTRLSDYNYSTPGAYFVTICTHEHRCYFGKITNATMKYSNIGRIVLREIEAVGEYNSNINVDKYIVMPNHVHMIVRVVDGAEVLEFERDVSEVVRKFKAIVTRYVRKEGLFAANGKLWQESYNDHIIRGEQDYRNIWEYIDTNVQRWDKDRYFD